MIDLMRNQTHTPVALRHLDADTMLAGRRKRTDRQQQTGQIEMSAVAVNHSSLLFRRISHKPGGVEGQMGPCY